MLATGIIVKIIGAVYKIPLTAFIGGVGRGYFATAYNLCMPIHAITMGAFPVALSRLVSKYNSSGNDRMVRALKVSSNRLFFFVGIIGMGIMLIAAKPYSILIAASPKSIYTILVLAPSILFSSMAASYRGYYEGFMNMVPTSVSQTIDALFKMIFGLVFAKLTMTHLYCEYVSKGTVLGESVSNDARALSLIYPFTSAAAMLGVTLGALVSLMFVMIYHGINSPRLQSDGILPCRDAGRELLSFSLPIMVSCAVQSVFQFMDTASVQYALTGMDVGVLSEVYEKSLSIADISDKDVATYVYGLLSSSLDFKNLIPGITMSLGVCAVPAIGTAMQQGEREKLDNLVNSIYKYTVLISVLGGICLATFSRDILQLFYGASAMDIVEGCEGITRYFGYTACLYSIAGVAVFSVQAIGKPQKSILPYAVSGVIRIVLNLLLIPDERLVLTGSVVSGAVGYLVMAVWNVIVVCRCARVRINIVDLVLRPGFAAVITCTLWNRLTEMIPFSDMSIPALAAKILAFCIVYLSMCLLCGVLNLAELKSIAVRRE